MRRFNTRGVVAMEEENKNEEVSETSASAPASVDAAEAEAEVVDSAAEGEEKKDSIEEAEDVSETLEVAAESLRIAAANGGIDKHSARAIGALTQHLYNRVGLRAKAMPALESFGGASTRIGATQLALEGIKERVVEIWKSIIAALKRLTEWVKGHFVKVFGGAEKMVKRAEAIKKSANNASSKKIKEKSFESSEIVKRLYIDKTVAVDALNVNLVKINSIITEVLGTKASEMIANGEQLVKAIEDKANAFTIKASSGRIAATNVDGGEAYGTVNGELQLLISDELLGGMVYMVRTNKNATTDSLGSFTAFGDFKSGFVPKAQTKTPTNEKVTTLTINQIDTIATTVAKIGEELVSFRNTESKLNKLLNDATTAAEKASKSANDDVEETDTDGAAEKASKSANTDGVTTKAHSIAVRKAMSNLSKFVVGAFSSATSYPLTTGQAALSYCEKSLANYE